MKKITWNKNPMNPNNIYITHPIFNIFKGEYGKEIYRDEEKVLFFNLRNEGNDGEYHCITKNNKVYTANAIDILDMYQEEYDEIREKSRGTIWIIDNQYYYTREAQFEKWFEVHLDSVCYSVMQYDIDNQEG